MWPISYFDVVNERSRMIRGKSTVLILIRNLILSSRYKIVKNHEKVSDWVELFDSYLKSYDDFCLFKVSKYYLMALSKS